MKQSKINMPVLLELAGSGLSLGQYQLDFCRISKGSLVTRYTQLAYDLQCQVLKIFTTSTDAQQVLKKDLSQTKARMIRLWRNHDGVELTQDPTCLADMSQQQCHELEALKQLHLKFKQIWQNREEQY